jgi:tRNA(fMet)-specific endonuclease VapC
MSFLLDTCVISDLVAKRPNPGVVEWIDAVEDDRLFLSVITLGEVKRGIEKLPDSRRRSTLDEWLNEALLLRFRGRILHIDHRVMLRWGSLTASLELAGRKLPAMDSLIAATSLEHDLQLVTRNVSDFDGTGLVVHDPWRKT